MPARSGGIDHDPDVAVIDSEVLGTPFLEQMAAAKGAVARGDRRARWMSRAGAGLATLACLLGSACKESPPRAEPDQWDDLLDPVPGSRLRPIFRVGEDGTRAHVAWQDTRYGAPCEFRRASDAIVRCVPLVTADIGRPRLFADPSCTEPVWPTDKFPDGAVTVSGRHGCSEPEHYHALGEVVSDYYYDDGSCRHAVDGGLARRATPIPVEALVSATSTPAEDRSRIVPLVLEAADGSRQIAGAWDQEHAEEVVPGVDAAGQGRWVPRWEATIAHEHYADPACTVRLAFGECIPFGERPRTASQREPGECGEVRGRALLLNEIAAVYRAAPSGECRPSGLPNDTRAWVVDQALDDTAFARAPVVVEDGERLRHEIHANPEGEPLLSSQSFYDRSLDDAECDWQEPPPSASRGLECAPLGFARLSDRYVDAACTRRSAWRERHAGYCDEPRYAYAPGVVARIVAALHEPSHYVIDEDGECDYVGGSSGGWYEEQYLVEEPPLRAVARATDVVE